MVEAIQVSRSTGGVRSRPKVAAPHSRRQAAALLESSPFTDRLVKSACGFDVTHLPGFRMLRADDPGAEAPLEASIAGRPTVIEIAALSGSFSTRLIRGVTNRQFSLDCLLTRPVPSASQDVRAGFLFGGSW